MNAFCNTDDITWGTKNLDTKRDVSQAKTLLKSSMAYSGPQGKESKSFWQAMMKVHEKLTDINQIKAYNAIKEAKLKSFATYLLIAWLTTNIIFVQIVNILSALSWEVREGCAYRSEGGWGVTVCWRQLLPPAGFGSASSMHSSCMELDQSPHE